MIEIQSPNYNSNSPCLHSHYAIMLVEFIQLASLHFRYCICSIRVGILDTERQNQVSGIHSFFEIQRNVTKDFMKCQADLLPQVHVNHNSES